MDDSSPRKANFGTGPVFLTAISTILGAIMFLRFGYAVGHAGFLGTVGIILVGHLVTVPTALAIAEIATNQRVEGGGKYFILSRSFGLTIGAAIGIALFFAQAISVAFYVIAFAEAFGPVFDVLNENFGLALADRRIISIPSIILFTVLIVWRGADIGVKALYVVVSVLFVSLACFFWGQTGHVPPPGQAGWTAAVENPDSVYRVFAIVFPAFTGNLAGVGLSGDLKDPKRSIPLGTLAATFVGMLTYILIAYKLMISAPPEALASDQLIMSRIALWGPIIPIGLACATISSALGSYLVAPRTLQAIADDGIFPWEWMNSALSKGVGATNEPVNASLVTAAIAIVFVVLGDVDFVAQIITMFFMVTYGSICLVSFLEHFAADPAYRPAFRSRWYVSLFGAVLSVWLMFQISPFYSALSGGVMFLLYLAVGTLNQDKRGLSSIFQGAIFQISRKLRVFLQKSRKLDEDRWRPSIVCISRSTFQRRAAFDLLRWTSHRYGFGTFIHFIQGYLSRSTHEESREILEKLVRISDATGGNVYVDTIVSPSYTTAITQLVQLPGISGKDNNMVLFEFSQISPGEVQDIVDNYPLVVATGFDVCILASSERGFGYRREIDVWLTPRDYENAGLMIILAYILLGHPDWSDAVIRIFSVLHEDRIEEERTKLDRLITTGRLPISAHNVEVIKQPAGMRTRDIIRERSGEADLVIVGFRGEQIRRDRGKMFLDTEGLGNVLFVNNKTEIDLLGDDVPDEEEES